MKQQLVMAGKSAVRKTCQPSTFAFVHTYIKSGALEWWCYLVGSPGQSANRIVPQQ